MAANLERSFLQKGDWHMRSHLFCFLIMLATPHAWPQAIPASVPSGAEGCYQIVLKTLGEIESDLPKISDSASRMASLYVRQDIPIAVDGDPVFCTEAVGRCGGLMGLRLITRRDLHYQGILLYALRGPDFAADDLRKLQGFHDTGCRIVVFGPASWLASIQHQGAVWDSAIDNHADVSDGMPKFDANHPVIHTYDVANVMALWTWTGEFVAGCTRLGKMPTLYQGYSFPGGRERAKKIGKARFHDGVPVAMPPRQAGQAYLSAVQKCLMALHDQEQNRITEVARRVSATRAAGHALYCFVDGHAIGPALHEPRDPHLFIELDKGPPQKIHPDIHPGDFILAVSYVKPFTIATFADYDFAPAWHAAGAVLAGAAGGFKDHPSDFPPCDIFIDEHWPPGDAVVQFPGYDIKVLPPSGVLQLTLYDMICAQMLHAIVR